MYNGVQRHPDISETYSAFTFKAESQEVSIFTLKYQHNVPDPAASFPMSSVFGHNTSPVTNSIVKYQENIIHHFIGCKYSQEEFQ